MSPLAPGPIDPPGIAGSIAGGGWCSPASVVVVLSGTVVVVVLGWSDTPSASRRSAVADGGVVERASAKPTPPIASSADDRADGDPDPRTREEFQGSARPSRTGSVRRRDRSDENAAPGVAILLDRSVKAGIVRPMRCFAFHLMPYIGLDPSYEGPAWVTVPNSLYDPVVGSQLYNRYLDELISAEELGFDGVCVNEHHQNAYGNMPSPNLIASILARQTSKVKIAVVGNALPALRPPDPGGRGVRHDRRDQRRAAHRRDGRRRRARVLLVLGEPDLRPGAVPRGARPDQEGVDRARARSSGSASTSGSGT